MDSNEQYQDEISKLCPNSAVFLWNRLVRTLLFEDYKNEIMATGDPSSTQAGESDRSSSESDDEEDEEDEEEEEGDEGDEREESNSRNNSNEMVNKKIPVGMMLNPQMASAVDHFKIVKPNANNATSKKKQKKQKQKPKKQRGTSASSPSSSPLASPSQSSSSSSSSRTRNEWTPQEDRLFLEGLKKHSLNFREICKIIPNR